MIMLRPMHEDEYPAYLAYFIPDYAQEIASNYRLAVEASQTRAELEIAKMLPDGVKTPGQTLLCLMMCSEQTERHIGYIWYQPDTVMRTVFIYDFHIFSDCQGQGLGKKALSAFEQNLQQQGFEQVKLRVAGDNTRARHVYETSGFGVTGINMSKTITG